MTAFKPMLSLRNAPASGARFFRNLSIGSKLSIGFGMLVTLTLLVVALSLLASAEATATINRTNELRVPAALASSRARINLLTMFSDIRGYLALGDRRFLLSYERAEQAFSANLDELEQLASGLDTENQRRLDDLQSAVQQWETLPDQLFALRDDQIAREPAYRWLNTTGARHGGNALLAINRMIEIQAEREPSRQNTELLEQMAHFRSSFAAMFAGLRGYVTTANPIFRYYEYEVNLTNNAATWEQLAQNRDRLTPEQQNLLVQIDAERQVLIDQVPAEIYAVVESDRRREDLFLFNSEMEPLTIEMQFLLEHIAESQQAALQADLAAGEQALVTARFQTLIGGVLVALLGGGMAFAFWRVITGPVRRLTNVANQIEAGDVHLMARVESGDEIGIFARTFNSMTAKLRDSMNQIRQEKKRADDLHDVVIPIGVALASEHDFNQLLENMLIEAMNFCAADWGALFLRKDNALQPMMLHITSQQVAISGTSGTPADIPAEFASHALPQEADSMPEQISPIAYAALNGVPVNLADVSSADATFDLAPLHALVAHYSYEPVSLLALPLKNTRGDVLGVLQLMNARGSEAGEWVPFDENLQQMMVSFSSLAVAALESYIREQGLRQEIQQLRIEIDESTRQEQVSTARPAINDRAECQRTLKGPAEPA
jgi:CHASE3 domain sensor protein